ncbi:MAG: hypothetical protein WC708_03625 [Lentisphaeria bacterium]
MSTGNGKKYCSYKQAWEKINGSILLGFYLEAITLEESVISDRLISFLVGVKVLPDGNEQQRRKTLSTSFFELIARWKKNQAGKNDALDLANLVDLWRDKRNECVHGYVKSLHKTPTWDAADFAELLKETAEDGKVLAREVSDWHRKELRAHTKASKAKTLVEGK